MTSRYYIAGGLSTTVSSVSVIVQFLKGGGRKCEDLMNRSDAKLILESIIVLLGLLAMDLDTKYVIDNKTKVMTARSNRGYSILSKSTQNELMLGFTGNSIHYSNESQLSMRDYITRTKNIYQSIKELMI